MAGLSKLCRTFETISDMVEAFHAQALTLHGMIGGVSDQVIAGTHLLVALGKAPNTTGIGLDKAGVAVTPAGYV